MRRFAAFLLIPALSIVVPVLGLPAITSTWGSTGWADFAIGQSVGMAGAVIIELGWALNGPQRVARLSMLERQRLYWVALTSKLLIALIMVVVAAAVAAQLSTMYSAVSAISAAAAALTGLSPAWFFTGTGQPMRILLVDVVPKAAAVLLASAALIGGAPLLTYPVLLMAAGITSPLIGALFIGVTARTDVFRLAEALQEMRNQIPAVSGRAASGIYIALPVTLVALAAPEQVAVFAAIERLTRMALQICQAVPTYQQRWMGQMSDRDSGHTPPGPQRLAILSGILLGVAAGVVFVFLISPAVQVLFSGTISVPAGAPLLGALVITSSCISRATGGLVLVSMGKVKTILVSALWGAAVGVVSIPLLAAGLGVQGAIAGEVIAEITVLVLQFAAIKRVWSTDQGTGSRLVAQIMVRDVHYPRNSKIRQTLTEAGYRVDVHRASAPQSLMKESLHLLRTFPSHGAQASTVILSEFNNQHAALARLLTTVTGARLIVDWFVGLHETQVEDRQVVRTNSLKARYFKAMDTIAARSGSIVVTDTDTRRRMVSKIGKPRVEYLTLPVGAPDWAHAVRASQTCRDPKDPIRILYYGNYIPLHGLHIFLEALSSLPDIATRTDLTLVGDGQTRRDIEKLILGSSLRNITRFEDPVGASELSRLIGSNDVILGVFGTSNKAASVIPNKVWQGLLAGKIVITADTAGVREISEIVPRQLQLVNASSLAALRNDLGNALAYAQENLDRATVERDLHALQGYVDSHFQEFTVALQKEF